MKRPYKPYKTPFNNKMLPVGIGGSTFFLVQTKDDIQRYQVRICVFAKKMKRKYTTRYRVQDGVKVLWVFRHE